VITKVIPNRVLTTTDSTGGVAVRTEFVEVGGNKAGPSTGLLVGVIVAALLLLLGLVGVTLVILRRRRQRLRDSGSREEEQNARPLAAVEEVREERAPVPPPRASPFNDPPPSSSANPFETSETGHEGSSIFPSTATVYTSPDDAPPAYRMSSGPSPSVALSKERLGSHRL
jgi:hypothetical protein